MRRKAEIRYSMAFKQQVVADMEAGRFATLTAAKRSLWITRTLTVRRWLVRVERPDEADQIRQFKEQIRQLQQALGQTQMEYVLNESFLRMACERLGVDFEEFKGERRWRRGASDGRGTDFTSWLGAGEGAEADGGLLGVGGGFDGFEVEGFLGSHGQVRAGYSSVGAVGLE